MMLKGKLVFSGSSANSAYRFPSGAVSIASQLDEDAEQFEAFRAAVAEMEVKLFGK